MDSKMQVMTNMIGTIVILIFSLASSAFLQEHRQHLKKEAKTKKVISTTKQERRGVQQKTPFFVDFADELITMPEHKTEDEKCQSYVESIMDPDQQPYVYRRAQQAGKTLVLVNITRDQQEKLLDAARGHGFDLKKAGVQTFFDYYAEQFRSQQGGRLEVFLPVGEVFCEGRNVKSQKVRDLIEAIKDIGSGRQVDIWLGISRVAWIRSEGADDISGQLVGWKRLLDDQTLGVKGLALDWQTLATIEAANSAKFSNWGNIGMPDGVVETIGYMLGLSSEDLSAMRGLADQAAVSRISGDERVRWDVSYLP